MEKPKQPALNQVPSLPPETPAEPNTKGNLPPGHPPMGQGDAVQASGPSKPVVTPPALRNRWKAIRVALKVKSTGKEHQHDILLNQDIKLPDSPLIIHLQSPLPSFSMEGGVFTSKSEAMENPAVFATLKQENKIVFKGWMFIKFPDTHAFEHPDYALRVVDFVK